MKVLVTGSAGHLGEAVVRTLKDMKHEVIGVDIRASPFTSAQGCAQRLNTSTETNVWRTEKMRTFRKV
jgi:nucleoside-diphosphate-sugar epimerase